MNKKISSTAKSSFSTEVRSRALDSRLLFENAHELLIQHRGETYRLRQTRAGKLILTN